MNKYEDLEILQRLKESGALTSEEFEDEKKKILGKSMHDDDESLAEETIYLPLDRRYASLYCSSDEKVILGFCGGLAHKLGLPVMAIRVAVFISFFIFIGWFYFIGIFLPKLPTRTIRRK